MNVALKVRWEGNMTPYNFVGTIFSILFSSIMTGYLASLIAANFSFLMCPFSTWPTIS